MDYHRLWVITGLIHYVLYELVDSKCYGLLQVMGYHSMGYLRFDCMCWWTRNAMSCYRLWVTVKPEIIHTLGRHQILWVITGYGLSQV